ncbi:hypothetical protein TMEC50S_00902 [Thauera mechernichensis]
MASMIDSERTSATSTLTSSSMPTESRKKGMKIASPVNWIRFMSALLCGISRFSARPARKAPTIGSEPARCAMPAQPNTVEQHEDELRHPVASDIAEEPACELGQAEQHDHAIEHEAADQRVPEVVPSVATCQRGDHGEYEQGEGVGDDRAADGSGDGLIVCDAELSGDRVRQQCVRCEQACEQNRCRQAEAEDVVPHQRAHTLRNGEGEQAEDEAVHAVALEHDEVDLERG